MEFKITKQQNHYTSFDQSKSIKEAQILIDKINETKKDLISIRIDVNTIVQVQEHRSNIDMIVQRLRRKPKAVSLIEQIEYGHYA